MIQQYESKILRLFKSRKFWAAAAALVAVAGGYSTGAETGWQATQAVVAILASYIFGVAIEDNGNQNNTPTK